MHRLFLYAIDTDRDDLAELDEFIVYVVDNIVLRVRITWQLHYHQLRARA
jgi:hypothetical protein